MPYWQSAPVGSILGVFMPQGLNDTNNLLNITYGNMESKFSINSASGIISVLSGLDYEGTTSYFLVITSYGHTTVSSSLVVYVMDENEFYPVFSGMFIFETNESSLSNMTIGSVTATDGDRNDKVTYVIISNNLLFNLDPTSGIITSNIRLDREALTRTFRPPSSQTTLTIAATDDGSPIHVSIRDFTITLVDINDNSPTFSDSMYSNQLRENLPAGQEVFSVSATDSDLGTNSQITYSFTLANNQGSSNPFQIDPLTGVIVTVLSLDRELQPYYLFSILASDAGSPPRTSTAIANLTVIDDNDNYPHFPQAVYYLNISEGIIPGVMGTFTASDDDIGLNGKIEYTINSPSTIVVFEIDRNTGTLSNRNSFDFEQSSQETVTIIATDLGLPHRPSSATVVVNVTNVDEQNPTFQSASCDITVQEDVAIGTVVSTCSATDFDSISNAGESPITYSLTSTLFEVNPSNGTITTKAALDHEINSTVRLILTATDLSGHFSVRSIVVLISDVNDNTPQFKNTPYAYHFLDDDIKNYKQEFLMAEAVDLDQGGNETVSYSIGYTRMISEVESQVQIMAQDKAIPPHTSVTNLTVMFQYPCLQQKYEINPTDGRLLVYLLCSITVSPPLLFYLTLGLNQFISCHIVSNSPTEYLWLHNGTAQTNPALLRQSSPYGNYTFSEITYSHGGEYACRASSLAGGLQSHSTLGTIQGKCHSNINIYHIYIYI